MNRPNNSRPPDSNRPKWELLDTLADGDFSLEVKKLPHKAPAYSLAPLAAKKDGSGFSAFIPVKLQREGGKVSIANAPSQRLEALIRNAEELILRDAQMEEDKFHHNRSSENDRADGGKNNAPRKPKGNFRDPGHP